MLAAQTHHLPLASLPSTPWLHALLTRVLAEFRGAQATMRRLRCGMSGHAMVLRFEPKRVSLQCYCCGHNTPGWDIESR